MKIGLKNIGVGALLLFAVACSKEIDEEVPFLPENPNPGGSLLPPNEQWAWVGKYPGEVNNAVKRLEDVKVTVKGNYTPVDLKTNAVPKYWQSSGLYVPPAELVTVTVPAGVTNLRYQIGVADIFLPSEGVAYKRYADVTKNGELKPGVNNLDNNFGGHLYFYFDGQSSGDVELTVSGAVQSPDYILGETDLAEWKGQVTDPLSPMIWGELRGKRVIMTLPISVLKQVESPEGMLSYYDKLIEEEYNPFYGISNEEAPVWRIYTDIQLPQSSQVYPGYPMAYRGMEDKDSLMNRAIINLYMNVVGEQSSKIHEMLASSYSMNWSGGKWMAGHANKLNYYHYAQSRGMWSSLGIQMDRPVAPWTSEDPLDVVSDNKKITILLQLAQQYGWKIFTYMSKRVRETEPVTVPDQYKNDLLAMCASEYAGKNLTKFFEAWTFPLSSYAYEYMAKFQDEPEEFWNTINTSIQPDMNSEREADTHNTKEIAPVIDTVYDRSAWTITSNLSGNYRNMLDGSLTTWFESGSFAGPNHSPKTEVNLDFVFGDEGKHKLKINYLKFGYRTHHNNNLPPWKFRVYYKASIDDLEWTPLDDKTYYLPRSTPESAKVLHDIWLSKTMTAASVRLLFTDRPQNFFTLSEVVMGVMGSEEDMYEGND